MPPLPRMEISPDLASLKESRLRAQSSETRKPVENKSSKITLSRRDFKPVGEAKFCPTSSEAEEENDASVEFPSSSVLKEARFLPPLPLIGASSNLCNSSAVIKSSSLWGVFASSILSGGREATLLLPNTLKRLAKR